MQDGRTPTILVIDDDASVRTTISVVLHSDGYQVLEAGNVADAQAIWNERGMEVSILIVDIQMPGSTGPDLVRKFLHGVHSVPPVIFVTGSCHREARRTTLDIPQSDVLQKPFAAAELLNAIERKLKEKRER